jgi:wyosine [tRNA(Phe)-imidazoG37] synthetase (radical SAM superfamily)
MGYVFGPVPSRRLGRSLGVDLVPFKTCTYDCIYCQLGRTTRKTVERREWVPLDEVAAELQEGLASRPDYVTLSGSGEPTLHSRVDDLIDRIRSLTDIPLAVLTNGSLLWQKEVRRQLLGAHVVMPSLDAGDRSMFNAVNRPHADIAFEQVLEGLIAFRDEYRGQYWLEVFLLGGHTAVPADARKIANCVDRIRPDRVQLNTVTRPPAEDYAVAVGRRHLRELAALFNPVAEVITDSRGVHVERGFAATRQAVLELLQRRPCLADDIARGLGIHRNEAAKHVQELLAQGLVERVSSPQGMYLRALQRLKVPSSHRRNEHASEEGPR